MAEPARTCKGATWLSTEELTLVDVGVAIFSCHLQVAPLVVDQHVAQKFHRGRVSRFLCSFASMGLSHRAVAARPCFAASAYWAVISRRLRIQAAKSCRLTVSSAPGWNTNIRWKPGEMPQLKTYNRKQSISLVQNKAIYRRHQCPPHEPAILLMDNPIAKFHIFLYVLVRQTLCHIICERIAVLYEPNL